MPPNVLPGLDNVVTVRYPIWHGIGVELKEDITAAEAKVRAANWDPEFRDLMRSDGVPVTTHRAIVRSDNGMQLGVVGSKYHLFSNQDLFDFFTAMAQKADVHIKSAGTLGGGTMVWVMANLGEFIVTGPNDKVNQYVLLATSHDTSLALTGARTYEVVVCRNTFNAAMAGASHKWSIKHTTNMMDYVEVAARQLELDYQKYRELEPVFQDLANYEPSMDEVDAVLEKLWPEREQGEEEDAPLVRDTWTAPRQYVRDAFTDENRITTHIDEMGGTAWGLYNSITEYLDWDRRPEWDSEKRFRYATDGPGADLKADALQEVYALIS